MKKNNLSLNLFILAFSFLFASANCQDYKDYSEKTVFRARVSFDEIVEYDRLFPALKPTGRRIENNFERTPQIPVDPKEIIHQASKFENIKGSQVKDPSPLPEIDFLGLDDSGGSIPPDVNGAAGPDHLMVTLNTDIRIMDKAGVPISTVGTGSFWQGIPGAGGVFDPKISYDPYGNRWIFVMPSSSDPTATRLLVAVSETSDPTGNWYMYSFDGDPDDELWFDYPNFGFNKKWIVVSGNMIATHPQHAVLYVFNKSDLYNYSFEIDYSRIEIFDGFSLIPAVTMDDEEGDVYVVNHAGGNVGGYGYLKLRKVTGELSEPQVQDIGLSGIPHPWDEWSYFNNGDFAPQLGSDEKINTVDARFENMVFRNNKLWCVHHVYIPADDPTRSAVQWWELATDGTILQWGREDGETEGMFYAYASIAVNAKEDVMIGYGSFSEEQYASASYSFRYADDPLNTLRERYQFKDGLAPYYKTFGGSRNRWGDYTATCVDPTNDLDFWTLQEYAEIPPGSQDEWGTWWAKVNVEAIPEAHFTSNITSVPVGSGVDFFDHSKFEPDEWKWIFEGGNPAASTEQNPANIVYDIAGLYDVTFVAINAHGADTLVIENYIDANTSILPEVYFSVTDTIPCTGDTVVFEDMTIYNPVSWLWEFAPNAVSFVNGTDETSENPQVALDYPILYDVTLTATNNNGSVTLAKSEFIKAGGEPLPFHEDFESRSFDRMGWSIENPDDSKTWEITQVAGTVPGGLAAYVNIKSYPGLNERDRLITPPLNFYAHKEITLSFQYAYSQRLAQYTDSLNVYISADCGNSWEPILAFGEDGTGTFATAGPLMDNFIPAGPEDWCGFEGNVECVNFDLSAWSGQSDIRVMFESFNRFGNNVFIDNLSIDGEPIGIHDFYSNSEVLTIFPNPTDGILYLNFNDLRVNIVLNVYDIRGRKMMSEKHENQRNQEMAVDLSTLRSGIYFIEVKDAKTSRIRKVIVK